MKRSALHLSGAVLWLELIATYFAIQTMTAIAELSSTQSLPHQVSEKTMLIAFLEQGPLWVFHVQYDEESQVSVALAYLAGVVLVGLWWQR